MTQECKPHDSVQGDYYIHLTRYFHSFFPSADAFGRCWTMDLPRLEKQAAPRDERTVQVVYQLTSPLRTLSERLTKWGSVDGRIRIARKDGGELYFNQAGHLVTVKEPPFTILYQRDKADRLTGMEGWYAGEKRAEIQLKHDDQGHLVEARGSNGMVVKYFTEAEGVLARVEGPGGVVAYKYTDGLVTEVIQDGKTVRQLEYAGRGRLLRERGPDGKEISYMVTATPAGSQIVASRAGAKEAAEYDAQFRPVWRMLPDGSQIHWQYQDSGAKTTRIALSGGKEHVLFRSADDKHVSWRLPGGGVYRMELDAAGRLVALSEGDCEMVRQKWLANGQLASAAFETVVLYPQYNQDRVLNKLLVAEPTARGTPFTRWMSAELDEQGRPREVRDYSDSAVKIIYAKDGQPTALVSPRGKIELKLDGQGRITALETSWGQRQTNQYDPTSDRLTAIEVVLDDQKAEVVFEADRPKRIKQFDGGETRIAYFAKDARDRRPREIRKPNGLVLTYEYDDRGRIRAVNCGEAYRLEYSYDSLGRLSALAQLPRK